MNTVILTGGGSGGHITPLMAVAKQLKIDNPAIKLIYIGQRGDGLIDIPSKDPNIDEVKVVFAGKFRRYHGEGFRQLLDLKTLWLNFRDFFYVVYGTLQTIRLLGKIKPDVMFSRGGFVSVPVGLASAFRRIPYITHDSDPIPSLANRIIARWATVHAVALPKELYPYDQAKTVTTGIPLNDNFTPVTPDLNKKFRDDLDLSISSRILFVIGGGLGSKQVNDAIREAMPHLLSDYVDLHVFHVVGRNNLTEMQHYYSEHLQSDQKPRIQVLGYIDDVYRYSGAADVVVTRAGATNLAEFAVQGRACIVIPSPFLAAGHQLKNAEILEEKQAALVISEDDLVEDSNRLANLLVRLLNNSDERKQLAKNLSSFAQPNAAEAISKLITDNI